MSKMRRITRLARLAKAEKKGNPKKINYERHDCGDGYKGKVLKRTMIYCSFCGAIKIHGRWTK